MKKLSPFTTVRLIRRGGKKVRAHRWIMEQHLGRKLTKDENVHHINKDPLDNRLENLQVLKFKEHMRLHKLKYPLIKNCEICGRFFATKNGHRGRDKSCSKKVWIQNNVQKQKANPCVSGKNSMMFQPSTQG